MQMILSAIANLQVNPLPIFTRGRRERKPRPPRRGGSGSGRSRYQYDTPITWLRKAIVQEDAC